MRIIRQSSKLGNKLLRETKCIIDRNNPAKDEGSPFNIHTIKKLFTFGSPERTGFEKSKLKVL